MLQWVPAHVGIAGKETTDRLAKAAAKLPQPHFSTTYKEVKTLLKRKQKSAWRLKNNGYDPQKDQINTLDRRTQTTIFRLRTGHCGLRKHLKRLGLADSAHCECGSMERTPEHILQTCPHLETVRQQFWPEDTEVGTKLWGQAAELQRTADFLAAAGLRIWHSHHIERRRRRHTAVGIIRNLAECTLVVSAMSSAMFQDTHFLLPTVTINEKGYIHNYIPLFAYQNHSFILVTLI